MTIKQMAEIEPRLLYVIELAKELNHNERYWADAWYQLKPKMTPLIGDMAADERLCSSELWDAFHDHLSLICNKCR